ncbi:hypothetical protein ACQ4WX_32150 [Streptomyces lasalocidi]
MADGLAEPDQREIRGGPAAGQESAGVLRQRRRHLPGYRARVVVGAGPVHHDDLAPSSA